jgi:hypothetical protein
LASGDGGSKRFTDASVAPATARIDSFRKENKEKLVKIEES